MEYRLATNHTKEHEKRQMQIYLRVHRGHGGKINTLHHEEHEGNEVNPGSAALRSGILDFAVPSTNASPLDHARRAAGGG